MIPVEESFLQFSFDLVVEDDLRTLDSLQLSAAWSLNAEDTAVVFVCADRNLASVAEKRSLETRCPGA